MSQRNNKKQKRSKGEDAATQEEIKNSEDIPEPDVCENILLNLTTHTDNFDTNPIPLSWGHPDPSIRGPILCTIRHQSQRNAIGAHQGSYCVYTGLAVAAGKLDPNYVPDLRMTRSVFDIPPTIYQISTSCIFPPLHNNLHILTNNNTQQTQHNTCKIS